MKEESKSKIRLYFIRHGETEGNLEKKYVGRTDEPLSPEGIESMEQLRKRMCADPKKGTEIPLKIFISPMRRCLESVEVLFRTGEAESEKPSEFLSVPEEAGGERPLEFLSVPEETGGERPLEFLSVPEEAGGERPSEFSSVSEGAESRKSAEFICTSGTVERHIVFDFRECDFGAFEYRNYRELMQDEKLAPLYQAWIDSGGTLPFPGGETVDGFKKRCVRAFEEIMVRNGNKKSVMFLVHGGTIMAILEAYGEPKKGYYDYQLPCADGYVCDYLPQQGVITNIKRLE